MFGWNCWLQSELNGLMASQAGEEEECDGQMGVSLSWCFHQGTLATKNVLFLITLLLLLLTLLALSDVTKHMLKECTTNAWLVRIWCMIRCRMNSYCPSYMKLCVTELAAIELHGERSVSTDAFDQPLWKHSSLCSDRKKRRRKHLHELCCVTQQCLCHIYKLRGGMCTFFFYKNDLLLLLKVLKSVAKRRLMDGNQKHLTGASW